MLLFCVLSEVLLKSFLVEELYHNHVCCCRWFLILWQLCLSIYRIWDMNLVAVVSILLFTLYTHFALSVTGILWWLNLNLAVRGYDNYSAGTHGHDMQNSDATLQPDPIQGGLPTPASLAEVILSTRQILSEQAAEDLSVCTFRNLIHTCNYLIS